YSNGTGGECVQVADTIPGTTPVRDSKNPAGPRPPSAGGGGGPGGGRFPRPGRAQPRPPPPNAPGGTPSGPPLGFRALVPLVPWVPCRTPGR
ncbi:DUF397 domain-containing protein, partial [Streptomyces sp. NPDC058964]|uniref:DUF397 domain-containing protein n=1 Tax=Streptomyces sp. NPDC058964 TaxID=3346681 RepID=UPI00368DC458